MRAIIRGFWICPRCDADIRTADLHWPALLFYKSLKNAAFLAGLHPDTAFWRDVRRCFDKTDRQRGSKPRHDRFLDIFQRPSNPGGRQRDRPGKTEGLVAVASE